MRAAGLFVFLQIRETLSLSSSTMGGEYKAAGQPKLVWDACHYYLLECNSRIIIDIKIGHLIAGNNR